MKVLVCISIVIAGCAVQTEQGALGSRSAALSLCTSAQLVTTPRCQSLGTDHKDHICVHDFGAAAQQGIQNGDDVTEPVGHVLYALSKDADGMTLWVSGDAEVGIVTRNATVTVPGLHPIYSGSVGCSSGAFEWVSTYFVKGQQEYPFSVAINDKNKPALLLVDPEVNLIEVYQDSDCDGAAATSTQLLASRDFSTCEGIVASDAAADPNDGDACALPDGLELPALCTPAANPEPQTNPEPQSNPSAQDESAPSPAPTSCDLETFPSNCYLRGGRATDARDTDEHGNMTNLACSYDDLATIGEEHTGLDPGERWKCIEQNDVRLWDGPYCEPGYHACDYSARTTKPIRCVPQTQPCP